MSHWPAIRAGLIALHILAVTLMAMPSPEGGMRRSAWKDPTIQGELKAWTQRVNAVGVDWTQAEVEEFAWDAARRIQTVRGWALAPFMPYYRYCGTWQSWKMFVAPHRYPSRLYIELEGADGTWRKLYVARSNEWDWHREQLDHDRMRAAIFRYGWRHYRRPFSRFGRWVAGQVAAEFPEAKRVQLRFYKYRTASPEEVLSHTEPAGQFQRAVIFELEDFR